MKKQGLIIATLLLTTFYLLLPPIKGKAAEPTDLKSAIEARLKDLQTIHQQIQQTQRGIEVAQQQQKSLKRELSVIDYSVNQVKLGIKASGITIEKLNLEIEAIQNQIAEAEQAISLKQETITKLLRELQQADNDSLLVALLKSKSLAETFSEAQTIQNLNEELFSEVVDLQQLQATLSEIFKNRSIKKGLVVIENQTLKNRHVVLEDQKVQRSTLLAQTRNQEQVYKQQLGELEKKQQEISDAIEVIEDELRRTFDTSILPIKRPGVFVYPVEDVRITQHWGEVSWLYRGRPHNGMDFGAPLGTAVYAADDGQVIGVSNNGRYQYGRYIVIRHDNNLATLYAHLSRQAVAEGAIVKRGDLIGYSGNTGYSFGPHLHFGVYWVPSLRFENVSNCNCLVPIGITVNPLDYL